MDYQEMSYEDVYHKLKAGEQTKFSPTYKSTKIFFDM